MRKRGKIPIGRGCIFSAGLFPPASIDMHPPLVKLASEISCAVKRWSEISMRGCFDIDVYHPASVYVHPLA
jgi:hypothetical protein